MQDELENSKARALLMKLIEVAKANDTDLKGVALIVLDEDSSMYCSFKVLDCEAMNSGLINAISEYRNEYFLSTAQDIKVTN